MGVSTACWQDVLNCIRNVNTDNSDSTQTTLTLQQVQLNTEFEESVSCVINCFIVTRDGRLAW